MITRKTLRLGLAASLLTTAACWSSTVPADPPDGWDFRRFDEALGLAEQEQRPVFLYFGRQGCPSCDKTNRESFSDKRVAARYQANYVLAYADAESGDRLRLPNGERITEMELGVRLNVFGTPFFYVMEPDGSPVARLPGYQDAQEFLLFDSYVSGGHYQQQTFAEFKRTGS
jgi:thioredoxin-related protein